MTTLSAQYSSPNDTHEFSLPLSVEPSSSSNPTQSTSSQSTSPQSAYLHGLRESIQSLQNQVNIFITTKMEEDNTRASSLKNGNVKHEEELAEQNYGEEPVEEDDV